MRRISRKFAILVELIRSINILNLTFVMAIILSFLKINKYISFIIVMLLGIVLTNVTQKIITKYVGDNKSILQSKFFVVFAFLLNIVFLVYFFLVKEYVMLILLSLFLFGFSLWKRMIDIKEKSIILWGKVWGKKKKTF